MKTATYIPDDIFDRIDGKARELGISRSEILQHAVSAYLQQIRDEGVTEALNAIYEADPEAGRLDPLLERMQSLSIVPDDWK